MLIYGEVSDVERQGQAGDEDEPLDPKQGFECSFRVHGCGRGPNPGDQRDLQPRHPSQATGEARNHRIGQGSHAKKGHHRLTFRTMPLEFVEETQVECEPQKAPCDQHCSAVGGPKPLAPRGHVLGVFGVFDGALNAVPQACRQRDPCGHEDARTLQCEVMGTPNTTHHGGCEGPKRDPNVGEREPSPCHDAKVVHPRPQMWTWWTGC